MTLLQCIEVPLESNVFDSNVNWLWIEIIRMILNLRFVVVTCDWGHLVNKQWLLNPVEPSVTESFVTEPSETFWFNELALLFIFKWIAVILLMKSFYSMKSFPTESFELAIRLVISQILFAFRIWIFQIMQIPSQTNKLLFCGLRKDLAGWSF